jgi:hypothetical protein
VHELLDQIGVSAADRKRIWHDTAAAWLGPAIVPPERAQALAQQPPPLAALPGGWLSAPRAMARTCC